jgi:murein hydrolase activator
MASRSFNSDSMHECTNAPMQVRLAFLRWCILAFVPAVLFAQAPDRARTEALARRATERMHALQREADRLASEERTLIGDLRKVEIDRQLKAEQLKQIDNEAGSVQTELETTARRTEALKRSEEAERPELRARIVEIYKLGQARYLRLLLSTPDLRRVLQASRTVATLARLDRERVASHQRTLDALAANRATLEERSRQLAALRVEAANAEAAAQKAARVRNDLIRDIDRRRDLNAQLSGELQSAQQKLQASLREMVGGAPAADAAVLPLRPFRGDLDWPVVGTVRRRFNPAARADATSNGIEISAAEGAEASAIHDGTVAFAGPFSGFGNLVILDHGLQTFSLYGDLLEISTRKGAHLERGQPIGSVGATPSGTAGLYFELRVDGRPVDPLQWLKKR